jgi:hypothetical protein
VTDQLSTVLIVVAACWGQVEYSTKQLMPWKILTQGPAGSEQTLLLDYVSPWNVLALFASLKKRHVPVMVAISVSLLLKLTIVISTGLFLLQGVELTYDSVPMVLADRFDGKNINSTTDEMRPPLTILGVKRFGLEIPHGTTEMFATQSFNYSNSASSELPTDYKFFFQSHPLDLVTNTVHRLFRHNHCFS